MNNKAILVYDGDCGFCQRCVDYLKSKTSQNTDWDVSYEPYQICWERLKLDPIECEKAVHYILIDQKTGAPENRSREYRGASAIFELLYSMKNIYSYYALPKWFYENIIGFKYLSEFIYRVIANNRGLISKFLNR